MVGITAGASAPEVLVEDLVEALRRIAPVEVSLLPGIVEDVKFRLPSELLDASYPMISSKPGTPARGAFERDDKPKLRMRLQWQFRLCKWPMSAPMSFASTWRGASAIPWY